MKMPAAPLAVRHRDKALKFRRDISDHCLERRAGNLDAAEFFRQGDDTEL